ncbi:alpha/beta fold hydrolase [Corynebacterium bovis]|uniref:alpha/beta fold hydrolase n=1 Tax=Corynebacterium bovis TaxID=36808 RepID=UPI00254ACB97|nr:alpha/beta fold hydrolase [Corynebacterium bovis]MDK8510788.1 alpha/beta fold hydrolase [Corynebacterium bovis]
MRVVFIPGMARTGADADAFSSFLPPEAHVVPADRPGPGWSGGPLPDTHFRHDLAVRQAVAFAGEGPVVYVAHSFGGYIAEIAARQLEASSPGQVRGIVFLDSSTPGVPRPIMDPRRLWALWRPVIWALDRASGVVDDHRVSTLLATGAQAVRENASFRATAREVRRERRRRPGARRGADGRRHRAQRAGVAVAAAPRLLVPAAGADGGGPRRAAPHHPPERPPGHERPPA